VPLVGREVRHQHEEDCCAALGDATTDLSRPPLCLCESPYNALLRH
jgi:hypothetical protein